MHSILCIVGTKIIADPEKSFQELISEKNTDFYCIVVVLGAFRRLPSSCVAFFLRPPDVEPRPPPLRGATTMLAEVFGVVGSSVCNPNLP